MKTYEQILREKYFFVYNEMKTANDKEATELKDLLTVHIAMYLSSYGMYRGSSKIFKYFNYKVHEGITEIVLKEEHNFLYDLNHDNFDDKTLKHIYKLYQEIWQEYEKKFTLINHKEDNGIPTKTLVTKIILGIFGCMPAYDSYVEEELKLLEIKHSISNEKKFFESMKEILEHFKDCELEADKKYPYMKKIDMNLFMIGKVRRNKNK